jgi:phosphohistidine phosphatase
MRRLILLRHAKAESVSASGGDIDRALTPRGWRDAALIGRVLAEAGFSPDLILTSPAKRAAETCRTVAECFPAAGVDEARALYLASAEQIALLAERSGETAASLMIVGHNPGLHEFAASLVHTHSAPAAALVRSFPTAAAAVFETDSGGKMQLSRFLAPKDHGGGAL